MAPKLLKAAEVCDVAQVQPYVLRSWEKEFPGIGIVRSADHVRLYRQSDVEHILRIKQLVFGEGLTLAGARRRLDALGPPEARSSVVADEEFESAGRPGANASSTVAAVRQGLRSLLDALSHEPGTVAIARDERSGVAGADTYELQPPPVVPRDAKSAATKVRSMVSRGGGSRVAGDRAGEATAERTKRKRASA
jgi:DNA-binding transcriptional MerR regulator